MKPARSALRALGLTALACGLASPAAAAPRLHVIAVGNNAVPRYATADADALAPLRFADDDAAAFVAFTQGLADTTTLLAVLDEPSQRRFPEQVPQARLPTLEELRRVLARLRERLQAEQQAGDDPEVIFFFSGHGTRSGPSGAALALLDAPLTQEVLYEEILTLPARYIHLIIDACHAEAVVRPRDLEGVTAPVRDEDVRAWAARSTLSRFANVGAILATAAGAQSHEWDLYQRGVFSHEVVSGLRGAADVNGDGRIEYSELAAFLGAANREVADPRARLAVVVHPPDLNKRTPIVDLTRARGVAHLSGHARPGGFWVEDDRGARLADVHAEPGAAVSLLLPTTRTLYVCTAAGDAELTAPLDAAVSLERLSYRSSRLAARGAVESSLHHGLFATEFGPRYYRGFVDHADDLMPVPEPKPLTPAQLAARNRPPRLPRSAAVVYGVAAVTSAVTLVLTGLAADATAQAASPLERASTDGGARARALQPATAAALAVTAVAVGVAVWLDVRGRNAQRRQASAWFDGAAVHF